MRCRTSIRRSRRRGASPSSALTSASAAASTWRPLGALFAARLRPMRDTSTTEVDAIGAASVQEVAVFLDVRGEIERMLAHQPLGELRVAVFQRLDDLHVIDDRSRGAIALGDRHPPDRAHMNEEIL